MSSGPVRVVLIVVGVIALVTGLVWIGQGLNLIPGSFMTGNRAWFAAGLVAGVIGLALIALGVRRGGRPAGRV